MSIPLVSYVRLVRDYQTRKSNNISHIWWEYAVDMKYANSSRIGSLLYGWIRLQQWRKLVHVSASGTILKPASNAWHPVPEITT